MGDEAMNRRDGPAGSGPPAREAVAAGRAPVARRRPLTGVPPHPVAVHEEMPRAPGPGSKIRDQ